MNQSSLRTEEELLVLLKKRLPYSELFLQVVLQDYQLLIIFNIIEGSQLTYARLAEELMGYLAVIPFASWQSLNFYGRVWGESEWQWQQEVALPILPNQSAQPAVVEERPNVTPTKPFKPDKRYRSAIEIIVVEETKALLERINQDRGHINLSQAIAYVLNRLPPMYATTESGWLQLQLAISDNIEKIHELIYQSFEVVGLSPREASNDLVNHGNPSKQAQVLIKLCKMLGKKNLRWRDLPESLGRTLSPLSRYRHKGFAEQIKSYIKRSKLRDLSQSDIYLPDFGLVETDWFKVYMSEAMGEYVNVLEKIVAEIAKSELPNNFNQNLFDDIIAYTLNQLPPMYATSDRGIEQLCQKALTELHKEIDSVIQEALEKIGKNPRRDIPPLPFQRFETELDFAIKEVKQMLGCDDVDLDNLVEVLENELTQRGITAYPYTD